MLKRRYLLILIIVFLIPQIQAFEIYNTTLNTTVSKSSITFSIPVEINWMRIQENSIYLSYVVYEVEGIVKICKYIEHTKSNSNLDSADFNCPEPGSGLSQEIVQDLEKDIDKAKERDARLNMIIKGIICLTLIIIWVIVIFISDMMERDKKMTRFSQIMLIIITGLVLFLLCLILSDLILGVPFVFTPLKIILISLIPTLIALTLTVNVMKKKTSR